MGDCNREEASHEPPEAAFMCLALPGKQHFGKPPADGTGFLSPEDDGAAPSEDVRCL